MTFSLQFAAQFVWGLVIIAAFIGWGGVIRRLVRAKEGADADWGLLAGWGMAGVIFIGGILNLLHLARPGPVIVVVAIGAVAALWENRGRRPALPALSILGILGIAVIVLPIISRYAAAVSYEALSCGDDNIAYFPFIVRMLDTGTLHDPFSLRRLAGHGGQTFLQALSVALGNEKNAYLVDRGSAMIVCFGLVAGYLRDQGEKSLFGWLLPLLLVVLLPFPMLNSASHITGLAMFLTLFRTLDRLEDAADHRLIIVTGLVVAGAAALRAHYVFAAAVTVGAFFFLQAAESGRWRQGIRDLLSCATTSAGAFIPWMAVLWQSSGTPLYPLFRGTHRADYDNYGAALDMPEKLAFLGDVLFSPGIALFAAPVLLYLFRRPSRAGLGLYVAGLMTALVFAWAFTLSDAENIHRYVAPILNAAFIATTAVFVSHARAGLGTSAAAGSSRIGDVVLCTAMVFLLPVMAGKDVGRLADHWGRSGLPVSSQAAYSAAQESVPPGAGIFTVVSHPYALDHRRNRIAAVDVPGAASPDPGVPYFQGPAALKAYLKSQGLSHAMFRDFDRPGGCLYDRRLWHHNTTADYPEGRFQAKYYLDLMDNLQALAMTEDRTAGARGLTVLRFR